jgi:hypothetical protein
MFRCPDLLSAPEGLMTASIDAFLTEGAVFEPDAARALATAFDQVCAALNLPANADHDRETIAVRIIDLARTGVHDPQVLRDRVLLEAGRAR